MPILSATIRARKAQIFELLADYQKYADWTADTVHSVILAKEGDIVVAEFCSPELMEDKYVLEFVQSKPTLITYKQVDQYGSRGLTGSWSLTDSPDAGGVVLTGEMNFTTTLRRSYRNRRKVELVLQRRLDAIEQILSDSSSVQKEHPLESGKAVLGTEILGAVQHGDPLAICFLGQKYVLKKVR